MLAASSMGKEVEIHTPLAEHLGISTTPMKSDLMPHLTLAQNVFIGREPRQGIRLVLDENRINAQTQALFDSMHLRLDPYSRSPI